MSAAKHTPGRRVVETAWGHTIFVRPPSASASADFWAGFERRALMAGRVAVIDGNVIEPSTPAAEIANAAVAKTTGEAA